MRHLLGHIVEVAATTPMIPMHPAIVGAPAGAARWHTGQGADRKRTKKSQGHAYVRAQATSRASLTIHAPDASCTLHCQGLATRKDSQFRGPNDSSAPRTDSRNTPGTRATSRRNVDNAENSPKGALGSQF
jgi:hypothetical protein